MNTIQMRMNNTNEDELNYRTKALMNYHIYVFSQILKHIRQTKTMFYIFFIQRQSQGRLHRTNNVLHAHFSSDVDL